MGRRKIIAGDPDKTGQSEEKSSTEPAPSKSNGRFWQIALVVVACFSLAAFSLSSYYYNLEHAELLRVKAGQASLDIRKEELKKVLAEAAKRIVLPKGLPLAAQILDEKNIGLWPFLGDAKTGDWVLIYPQGVFVYRSASLQLVATAEVKFSAGENNVKKDLIRLAIRNGGAKQGAASDMADEIKSLANYSIADIGNAATDTYRGNLIVNPANKPIDDLLALVRATVTSSLPLDEASTTADILLIIGN